MLELGQSEYSADEVSLCADRSTVRTDEWGPAFRSHMCVTSEPPCKNEDGVYMRDMWDLEMQLKLANYLYHGNFALDGLRERTRRVAPVKAIMDGFLNLPSMLSGIYWTEFLKIRTGFFVSYDRAVREHMHNIAAAPKKIYDRLTHTLGASFDRTLARRDLASAVERAMDGYICPLCYENPKDACFLHDRSRGCTVCRGCAFRFQSNTCPFCRAPIMGLINLA